MVDQNVGTLKPEQLLPHEREVVTEAETHEGLLGALELDPDFAEGVEEIEDDDKEDEEVVEDDDIEEEDPVEEDDLEDEEDDLEDEEESEEDDEEEGDDEEDPDLHTVKYRGKEIEVPYDELIANYSRTKDYTEKTTEAAALKRAAEAETSEAQRDRAVYQKKLEVVEKIIKDAGPAERSQEYWDDLRQRSPAEYAAQREEIRHQKDQLAAVEAEKEKTAKEEAETFETKRAEYLTAEFSALTEAIPEWKDEAVYKEEAMEMVAFAQEAYGFSEEDIAGVMDHRLLLLLRDAAQGARAGKSRTKGKARLKGKATKSTKRMAPGGKTKRSSKRTRTSKAKKDRYSRSRQRLAESGDARDGQAAIEDLLGDDF